MKTDELFQFFKQSVYSEEIKEYFAKHEIVEKTEYYFIGIKYYGSNKFDIDFVFREKFGYENDYGEPIKSFKDSLEEGFLYMIQFGVGKVDGRIKYPFIFLRGLSPDRPL